ncbi:TetR/AcrR family transcriptional regulator [Paenibacillus sp. S150]|uniref:TetR/AcrR family transcriptional regulator n=1 Tax=Paenibacillus sp. S150 TaxID=2749826 RepID=UPI001C58CB05|nr:TetR/AcrR family transcriptional regulator [Paenibacillus sp. S150]MBW4083014.1 TetR/AcrR family transcriptional regulator [Paenibacillus sp. S150]
MTLREKQAEMTRRLIKQAALDLFCAKGIAGTDMALIAGEAGIARRTLYHHYKDKEALSVEIYIENLEAMFGQLLPDFDLGEPLASLERILDQYLELRQHSEALLYYDAIFNLYYSNLSKNPADLPEFQRIVEEGYNRGLRQPAVPVTGEVKASWLDKLFRSTHLLFCYLQKAVIITHQRGGPATDAELEEDRRFKEFIMNGLRNQE